NEIDFNDYFDSIPCYICIFAMPFFYSISEGIAMGVISYVALYLINPNKDKKMSFIMYILAIAFILKYILL
ncbi:MAG: NCS2 family permease, partial [Lachnospirales bacterium]